ncbi:MAG: LL-diaminopimelate aminotransferase [Candidatus Omnitrophica bacterium]|nr:LL-diaminopimelate aminotransferase [Candidatus Omnitrophota bacterium]
MIIEFNGRLQKLPPYLFIEIDRKKRKLQESGVDVIDFGIGDPDTPTPDFVISAMQEAVTKPEYHRYPLGRGKIFFRQACALWFKKRFGVALDPEKEVVALIGSKEGIGHLPFAFLNQDEVTLVPEPGYPVYANATILAGGNPFFLPLKEANGFLPDLSVIPNSVLNKARLIFLNYPNNPTGAAAPDSFWKEAISFCEKHGIILAADAAYSEVYYGEKSKSIFQFPGGKEVGIEFHSLSKTFNMTGWRVGFACGNEKVLAGLATVKENLDSGIFEAIQAAGSTALDAPEGFTEDLRRMYRRRMDTLVSGLNKIGIACSVPAGTFYLWVKTPEGENSTQFSTRLLEKFGIITTPGCGFGPSGDGYVRFSITLDESRIKEALSRLSERNVSS